MRARYKPGVPCCVAGTLCTPGQHNSADELEFNVVYDDFLNVDDFTIDSNTNGHPVTFVIGSNELAIECNSRFSSTPFFNSQTNPFISANALTLQGPDGSTVEPTRVVRLPAATREVNCSADIEIIGPAWDNNPPFPNWAPDPDQGSNWSVRFGVEWDSGGLNVPEVSRVIHESLWRWVPTPLLLTERQFVCLDRPAGYTWTTGQSPANSLPPLSINVRQRIAFPSWVQIPTFGFGGTYNTRNVVRQIYLDGNLFSSWITTQWIQPCRWFFFAHVMMQDHYDFPVIFSRIAVKNFQLWIDS